ncbi:formate dehydrogenase subunit alpha [Candidatus Thorarchaeota archaeon]|nr:MAG: formate dehydrogenase subunit alpha [Candidatus Thorarchaeota archaeon]
MIQYEKTICPYCSCGCGIYLVIEDGKIIGQEPQTDHPINEGGNCPKGRNAYQFLYAEDRLKTPMIRKSDELVECSWDEAFDYIVKKLKQAGPNEFGMLASGKNTNEDAYVIQKFTRLVMGTNNVEYCGRLCHSSTAAGLGPTVGSGVMPISQRDLENVDCIFLVGINLKETFPLMYMRALRAKERGAKVIVMDPRKSITARELSDVHLQINSGTDVAVINAMMKIILEEGLENKDFIESRTTGIDALREHLAGLNLKDLVKICGVPLNTLTQAAKIFAKAKNGSVLFNQGLNQHITGTDGIKALATLALISGHYGRPGTGLSPTRGQINGEGTGDMGCLNVFYPGFQKVGTPAEPHKKFAEHWGVDSLPENPGLPYTKMIQQTKYMWIIGTNPMMAAPDTDNVKKDLESKELLIVQDIFPTETAELADVVLPASTWVEREGIHAYVDRRVQKINKLIEAPGDAKPDWWIVTQIAERMGFKDKFDFSSPREIFEEIRRVVPPYKGITYERLEETLGGIQWPCPTEDHPGTSTFFTEKFNTPDGLGHLQVVNYIPPAELPDKDYPYILSTGRTIFHYHTGTMSRRTPKLDAEVSGALLQVNPKDATLHDITNGTKVTLTTRRGSIQVKTRITDDVPEGTVFLPFHFSESSANKITNPALDPACGMPEYKVCAVKMEVSK